MLTVHIIYTFSGDVSPPREQGGVVVENLVTDITQTWQEMQPAHPLPAEDTTLINQRRTQAGLRRAGPLVLSSWLLLLLDGRWANPAGQRSFHQMAGSVACYPEQVRLMGSDSFPAQERPGSSFTQSTAGAKSPRLETVSAVGQWEPRMSGMEERAGEVA